MGEGCSTKDLPTTSARKCLIVSWHGTFTVNLNSYSGVLVGVGSRFKSKYFSFPQRALKNVKWQQVDKNKGVRNESD